MNQKNYVSISERMKNGTAIYMNLVMNSKCLSSVICCFVQTKMERNFYLLINAKKKQH